MKFLNHMFEIKKRKILFLIKITKVDLKIIEKIKISDFQNLIHFNH